MKKNFRESTTINNRALYFKILLMKINYSDLSYAKVLEKIYWDSFIEAANINLKVINYLKTKKSTYSKINELGDYARKEITKAFDGRVAVTGNGSLFMTHFLRDGISEVTDSQTASRCDSKLLTDFHFKMISEDGIFFLPGKLGAISNAHTKQDIQKLVNSASSFN